LARHEGDFRAGGEEPLTLDELLALLAKVDRDEVRSRADMIATALSASDGWQEAVRKLGGAFAEEEPELKERKGE
jgi:hypothetical protein